MSVYSIRNGAVDDAELLSVQATVFATIRIEDDSITAPPPPRPGLQANFFLFTRYF